MNRSGADMQALLQCALYEDMCAEVDAEHSRLFSSTSRQSLVVLNEWSETWADAFRQRKTLRLSNAGLLSSGRQLARVAESYSANDIAHGVFECFNELAMESDPNGLEVAESLVGAGELNRRAGHIDLAVTRLNDALELIESQESAAAHKLASRTYYELAYVGLYRGDAQYALEMLARSEVEAQRCADSVGAGIARALSAAIRSEEGILNEPIESLSAEALNFAALAQSEELRRSGRHVFANRWRINCEIHRMQALLAAGEIEKARRAYDDYLKSDPNPSQYGNTWLVFTGACITLAEGDLEQAAELTKRCRQTMPQPFESQEAAASILALYGVIALLRDNTRTARDVFIEANALDAALRNAKGHGWAALGLAIIALQENDRAGALAALDVGMARCARCCALVRQALTQLRGDIAIGASPLGGELKAELRALTGAMAHSTAATSSG